MTSKEFMKRFDNGTLEPLVVNRCPLCKEELPDHPDPPRFIGVEKERKEVCEDCYWDEFGKDVGNYPICNPGRHGPGGHTLD